MKTAVTLVLLLTPFVARAVALPVAEPVPGGVAVVKLPVTGEAPPIVNLGDKRIMVIRDAEHWYAIAGLPLDMPAGSATLNVYAGSAPMVPVDFQVFPKTYPEQTLTIQNPELVNPTAEELKRIEREQAHLTAVMGHWRMDPSPGLQFERPAAGPESSAFGVKRILNGEPRSPHSGIDISGPEGTPVRAPADAIVADVGNYYFCGKTLTLDMGQGLFSVFCHLNRIRVSPGQRVSRGQFVGNMGATGRTTGPNLHWTVRLNGVPVDPHVFLGDAVMPPAAVTSAAPPATTSSQVNPNPER